MPPKDKHIPWIAVGFAGLLLALLGRYIVLSKGGDTGSANITFIIVLIGVIFLYFVWVAFVESISDFTVQLRKNKTPHFQELSERESENHIEAPESETISDQKPEETIFKPGDITQLREKVQAKEAEKRESDIALFKKYAHLVVGIYMSDKDVEILDQCIEQYANGEAVDEKMKPLSTNKLDNANLFHFGWNMHNFFKTGDKQAIIVDWLQAVFYNMRDLEYTTILGKLKHNERNSYLIPIVEDIRSFMAEQVR